METVKTCKYCGETKPLPMFAKSNQSKDGHRVICKPCLNKKKNAHVASKRDHYREYHKKYRCENGRSEHNSIHSRLVSAVSRAKIRRPFDFSIDVEYIKRLWENQNGLCVYTKLPLSIESNQFNTVSIDRIDSSKGYVEGNVQLVCRAVNEMKMDRSEDLFIRLCNLVSQNNPVGDNSVDLAVNR